MRGLLDSGASCTIIGKDLADRIELPPPRKTTNAIKLRMADGAVHMVDEVYDLNFVFMMKRTVVPTIILPQLTQEVILGMDFWQQYEIEPSICTVEEEELEKESPVGENHELSTQQAEQLQAVLKQMPFSKAGVLGKTHLIEHSIEIKSGSTPIRRKAYVTSPYMQLKVDAELDRMLELDVIEPAESSWNNPMVIVKKPNGRIRYCIDARGLNAMSLKDAYPLPNINRILPRLEKTRFLSSIDLSDAFWQIPLRKQDRCKTAFTVSGKGFFQFKRMPFGLINSASTLCKLIDRVIGEDLEPFVFKYLDDIIVATESFEQHVKVLEIVAQRLKAAGMTISVDKSKFCLKSLRYVGYLIDENGVRPDPEKIRAVLEYPAPKCVKDVRRLFGMASWYRRFIQDFASITAPITDLLQTKIVRKFKWTNEAQEAFDELKRRLTSSPVLAAPTFGDPWFLETDASDVGIGGVLKQKQGDEEKVIAYFSKKLSKAARKYTVTEREALAVISAIEKFRCYIEGAHFTVITDHASLKWLNNLKDPQGRLARWALRLQAHDYEILHRPGSQMAVPDALSRAVEMVDVSELVSGEDEEYKVLLHNVRNAPETYPDYRIENEILYRHTQDFNQDLENRWKVVVPPSKRTLVMKECHDDVLAGHGGILKTLYRIRQDYFWPKLKHDVVQYVTKCLICKLTKATNQCQTAPMGSDRSPENKFQAISLDFIGPLPMSKKRNRWLLVTVDDFTKYVTLHPMIKATAEKTIQVLEEHVITKFGTPARFILDNGTQFKAKLFRQYAERKKIQLWLNAYYHPQPNATEAANKTVVNAIRAYIKDDKSHRDWDLHLHELACAINNSVHSAIKMTPFYAVFGERLAHTGEDHKLRITDEQVDTSEAKYQKIRERIIVELDNAYQNRLKRYNLRTRPIVYYPGEYAFKKNFKLSKAGSYYMAKLDHKYEAVIIHEKVGSNCYKLRSLDGKVLPGTYSTQDLKK